MKGNMPTMKDVALEAGVALGTVSKVFNGLPVGDSYRIKVEEAAKRLGYQVNQYARGLRAGKTFTVALIVPGLDHPFFAVLAQHVCAALAQRDHRMLLYVTASRPDIEQSCISMVRQNKVDGIIGLTYNPLELDEDLPFVSIDRRLGADIPCVAADNFGGGRMAAEKLLELGCTRLAFLHTGSTNPNETDQRGDGFESVCRARGVPYDVLRLKDGDDGELFREFLRSHLRGEKLPEDVQLIGFDGIRRFGGQELYGSTIVQPVQRMAETAVDLLLTKDRSTVPALVCLPVSYAPGGTTRE